MLKATRAIVLVFLCLAAASICGADTIWDYEAVQLDGNGSHPLVGADPLPANRVTVEGVALAGVGELWDPDDPSDGQYTIFVQDDVNKRGGIQVWSGRWWFDTWRPGQYPDFSAGDRVRVTGFLGNHSGKVFINDRHTDDPDIIPTVEVIGHPGVPDPEPIPCVSHCNYFDQTRMDGGERYQTRWTMLHGVRITGGAWENGGTLTIADPTGEVNLYLPPASDVASHPQPAEKINIVGIFDQEDTAPPYVDSYRLIVKDYDDIATALDSCRDVRQRADGDRVALVNKVVSRTYDGCFYVQDIDRSGGVKVISDRVVAPGEVVCVQGLVSTSGDEKAISARYIAPGRLNPGALLVNGAALQGETGLNVFGLLVRCVGTVGESLGDGLYQFTDDSGRVIRLDSNFVPVPSQGSQVAVTAVLSGNPGAPILLLANACDIQPLP